jgi:hypothetical protein
MQGEINTAQNLFIGQNMVPPAGQRRMNHFSPETRRI